MELQRQGNEKYFVPGPDVRVQLSIQTLEKVANSSTTIHSVCPPGQGKTRRRSAGGVAARMTQTTLDPEERETLPMVGQRRARLEVASLRKERGGSCTARQ